MVDMTAANKGLRVLEKHKGSFLLMQKYSHSFFVVPAFARPPHEEKKATDYHSAYFHISWSYF